MNNYKIKNLSKKNLYIFSLNYNISLPAISTPCFFSNIETTGIVQNVDIIGGIAGWTNAGCTLEDCFVSASFNSETKTGGTFGLVRLTSYTSFSIDTVYWDITNIIFLKKDALKSFMICRASSFILYT